MLLIAYSFLLSLRVNNVKIRFLFEIISLLFSRGWVHVQIMSHQKSFVWSDDDDEDEEALKVAFGKDLHNKAKRRKWAQEHWV